MTRWLTLAAITTAVSLGFLFAACSGSSGVTFPDASTPTNDSGPTTTVGPGPDSGPASDGGRTCGPCETEKPDPACTTTDPCGCGPYTCPKDGGPSDDCTWDATTNPCGAGRYCNALGCGNGKCAAVGTSDAVTNNPYCGCDGVTYWNASVAAFHGMSIDKKGACNGGKAVACNSLKPCATGASCDYETGSLDGCATTTSGVCWVLPATCPPTAGIRDAKSCSHPTCVGECAAIRAGLPWYTDACLP